MLLNALVPASHDWSGSMSALSSCVGIIKEIWLRSASRRLRSSVSALWMNLGNIFGNVLKMWLKNNHLCIETKQLFFFRVLLNRLLPYESILITKETFLISKCPVDNCKSTFNLVLSCFKQAICHLLYITD